MKAVLDWRGVVLAVAAMLAAPHKASAQIREPGSPDLHCKGNSVPAGRPQPEVRDLVREIDDPHSGQRWLLCRDAKHPEGPGRMVPAGGTSGAAAGAGTGQRTGAGIGKLPGEAGADALPVIRAGDRVVLEEDSPMVEVRLEAVALGTAMAGGPLKVRLRIGGRVVRTVALAAGRVAPATESAP